MGDSLSAGDCLLISGTAAALDSAKYNIIYCISQNPV